MGSSQNHCEQLQIKFYNFIANTLECLLYYPEIKFINNNQDTHKKSIKAHIQYKEDTKER